MKTWPYCNWFRSKPSRIWYSPIWLKRKLVVLLVTLRRILIKKSKPITKWVFCGPPNQVNCLDLMVEKFTNLNLKDNDRYLLGDFIIHLFENGKYILNGKRTTNSQGSFHTLRNIYKQDILSNILFKAINSMSYLCNMQHLLSYWPYSPKFSLKDLSIGYNWLWNCQSVAYF